MNHHLFFNFHSRHCFMILCDYLKYCFTSLKTNSSIDKKTLPSTHSISLIFRCQKLGKGGREQGRWGTAQSKYVLVLNCRLINHISQAIDESEKQGEHVLLLKQVLFPFTPYFLCQHYLYLKHKYFYFNIFFYSIFNLTNLFSLLLMVQINIFVIISATIRHVIIATQLCNISS